MKKTFFSAALFAAIALFAGYNVHHAQKSEIMSDIALANVEALAKWESDGYCHTNADYTAICNYYDSGVICPCGF